MKLTIIHRSGHQADLQGYSSCDLLRFAVCSEPLSAITFSSLNGNSYNRSKDDIIAIPKQWHQRSQKHDDSRIYYGKNIPLPPKTINKLKKKPWFVIANGKYVTRIDNRLLSKILNRSQDDIIAVNVVPQLQVFGEKPLITSQNKLVGFRRFYNDSAQPAPIGNDWPHYLFINTDIFNKILVDNALPLAFSMFIDTCLASSLAVCSLNISGSVLDLEIEKDLLGLLTTRLNSSAKIVHDSDNVYQSLTQDNAAMPRSVRLFGKVILGQNVSIGQNVTIVGPTIIGSNARISKGAVIKTSIIAPGVSIPQNKIVQNRILVDSRFHLKHHCQEDINPITLDNNSGTNNFRSWPRFSYAGYFKRIADIVAALFVLVLFAPVFPIIALVIKLTSSGPVFFKDRRQGLHGQPFNCMKFRSMLVNADKMQDQLRVLNQADGPQFKLMDDPRISHVGNFLRETYLDEIPQFLNVLVGQMSIVGPRPSPESENTSCPPWRDARLSVRPGITGLWQICRTRQAMKDFQEWIYYDIKYVKTLSLKTDLWVCWRTAKKMAMNFIDQF